MAASLPVLQQLKTATGEIFAIGLDLGTTRSALSVWIQKDDKHWKFDICPDTLNAVPQSNSKTETVLVFSSAEALGTADRPVTVDSPVANASVADNPEWVHVGPQSFDAGEDYPRAYYVRDFKMELDIRAKKGRRHEEVRLNDIEVPAISLVEGAPIKVNLRQVVTAYIACAAKIAFSQLAAFVQNLVDPKLAMPSKEDVNWAITVPAIWTDQARIFMRNAAHAAGLSKKTFTKKIHICLEPEGAVLEAINTSFIRNPAYLLNKKVLVLDWGGGTCDITYSTVKSTTSQKTATLEEVVPPLGGAYGGRRVNRKLDKLIFRSWFGEDIYQKIWIEQGYRDRFIRTHFEAQKVSVKDQGLRFRFHDLFQGNVSNADLQARLAVLNESGEKILTGVVRGQPWFEIPFKMIADAFKACIDPMLDKVKPILEREPPQHIFVVGGMSESPFLKDYLQNFQAPWFPVDRLIFPENRSMTIVRGAVRFALDPSSSIVRMARTNYGIAVFDETSPEVPRWSYLVHKGQPLLNSPDLRQGPFTPPTAATPRLTFNIYETSFPLLNRDPLRDCIWVTSIEVQIDSVDQDFYLNLSVTGPVITGKITDSRSNKSHKIVWGSR